MPERILKHLAALVACETTNPPRAITGDSPIVRYAADVMRNAGCMVTVRDLGGGSVWTLGVRGAASTLFNCHLDTVPVSGAWSADPFTLRVRDGRAFGLGACDIKGAGAAMLTAIECSDAPAALLFSTDEEAGPGLCVKDFLHARPVEFVRAIVAEPTLTRAAFAHRGLLSGVAEFTGTAAHASNDPATIESAAHKALRWGAAALEWAEARSRLGGSPRLNIGVISGGTKSNVVAASATLRFGMRPAPGDDPDAMLAGLADAGSQSDRPALHMSFTGPALAPSREMTEWAGFLEKSRNEPLAFWTEAALFGEAGVPAAVLGPGDIAQAHTADEWVALDQLAAASHIYQQIMEAP